jgi:hypothetical protein
MDQARRVERGLGRAESVVALQAWYRETKFR